MLGLRQRGLEPGRDFGIVGFGMEMRGVPKAERREAIAKVAKTLQIEHLLARRDPPPSGGTCRMGNDDLAMVSPDLRARGIEGLRIAGSSVMPRVPSCNTNAPTIMIGEKTSDLILGREPLPPAVFDQPPDNGMSSDSRVAWRRG